MQTGITTYAKLSTDELTRRWRRLEADTSAYTVEAEMRRMFALQEIGAVLIDRGAFEQAV